ncbi:MAG: LysM domain-containing protein [Desulfohalobiaceae bacterium]
MERKSWLEQMKEFEHSSQETGQEKRRKSTFRLGEQFWKKPFFLGGLGLILLFFFISLMITSGDDQQQSPGELQEISSKLQRFEDRLAAVEESLSDQHEEMLLMQSADSNLGDRLQDVAQDLEKLQNQFQEMQKQASSQEEQKPPSSLPAAEKEEGDDFVYHEVQSGENLFRISQQYETTVQRLRELNGLDQDQPLQPGQKLKVGSKD